MTASLPTARTEVSRHGRVLRRTGSQFGALAGAVALWEILTRLADRPHFPPPSTIATAIQDTWLSGPASRLFLTHEATGDLSVSLGRLCLAVACAAVAGIAAGLALGRAPRVAEYFAPVLRLCRALPPPALIPFFVVTFHAGATMEVTTIVFGTVWPVTLGALDGARSVEPLYADTFAIFGVTGVRRLTHVVLPATAPKIFAGLRTGVSLSVTLMVLAELLGSGEGIGGELVRTRQPGDLWGGLVVLALLGCALAALFGAAERRCLRRYGRR
jgi:ABC-type nitrate/sulfonate/bicarbonate transport system permease component